MWKDLSLEDKSNILPLFIKKGIYRLSDIEKLYNQFAEGGDTNPMGYEHQGTVYDDSLKKQGITHLAELPEVTITGNKPWWQRDIKSAFEGYTEYLPDLVSLVPGAGDLQDAYNAAKDVYNGNYTQAGILGASLLLPNALEKPAKFLRNRFGKEAVQTVGEGVARKSRPELVADVTGKPHYKPEDIPDIITVNRAPEGKFHHQDELKLDGDYDFTEGHINDGAGHISPREYAKQFNDAFTNAKHGQAVAFLKDDDLSFDSYADIASFLAKQQKRGKVKIVKAEGAPTQMKLNGLGKNKFPNKETRASDMNDYLDRLNERYGTSFSHVTDKSEFVPYPSAVQKIMGSDGWTRSSFWLDPIVAVKLKNGGALK